MATIKYSDLLDEVLPNLAADPSDPVSEHAIKRAVIELCAGSWIWQYLMDPIDVTANEAYYDLEYPNGSDVSTVMSVHHNGVELKNKSLDWLNREVPFWRTDLATPKYFTQITPDQIILAQIPDATIANGLLLTLALEPSQSSRNFPRWIADQNLYTIADGAISTLMLMPNKPWTDIQNGAARRASFDAGIANARATGVAGLSRAPLRTSSQH